MTVRFATNNLQEVYSYPFQDPNWKPKLTLAIVICLARMVIPILPGLFFYGYCYRIIRTILTEEQSSELPEWDNWGELFEDGAKMLGVSVFYLFPGPLILVSTYIGSLIPLLRMEGTEYDVPIALYIWIGLFVMGMGLGTILSILGLVCFPLAVTHMVAKNKFLAAFHFRALWSVFRANIWGFALSFLLVVGTFMVINLFSQILILTIVLCVAYPIVWVFAYIYIFLIGSRLYAQAYKNACLEHPLRTGNLE